MSRIGRQPIHLPEGVEVQILDGKALVKGPNGKLQVLIHSSTEILRDGDYLLVKVERPEDRETKAFWGLTRSLIFNAVEGVTKGYEKRLVVVGVGYRADVKGKNLELQVGYSHPVTIEEIVGIKFDTDSAPSDVDGAQITVVVSGADKELVGRTAANIRHVRPPEPYKGKGIRYAGEYVRRKAGKTAVA